MILGSHGLYWELIMRQILTIFLTAFLPLSLSAGPGLESYKQTLSNWEKQLLLFKHPLSSKESVRYHSILARVGELQVDQSLSKYLQSKLPSKGYSGVIEVSRPVQPGLERVYHLKVVKGQVLYIKRAKERVLDQRWNKITRYNIKKIFQLIQEDADGTEIAAAIAEHAQYKDPRQLSFYLSLLTKNHSIKAAAIDAIMQALSIWDVDELNHIEKKFTALRLSNFAKKVQAQRLNRLSGKAKVLSGQTNLFLENFRLMGKGGLSQVKHGLQMVADQLTLKNSLHSFFSFVSPEGHIQRGIGLAKGSTSLIVDSYNANLSLYTGGHYGSFGQKTGEETLRLWTAVLLYRLGGRILNGAPKKILKIVPETSTGGQSTGLIGSNLFPKKLHKSTFSSATRPLSHFVNKGGPVAVEAPIEAPLIESLGHATPLRIGAQPVRGLGRNYVGAELYSVFRKNGLPLLFAINGDQSEITLFETDSRGKRYLPVPQKWKSVQVNIGGEVVHGITNGVHGYFIDSSGSVNTFFSGGEKSVSYSIQASLGNYASTGSTSRGGMDEKFAALERELRAVMGREEEELPILFKILKEAERINNSSYIEFALAQLLDKINETHAEFELIKSSILNLFRTGLTDRAYHFALHFMETHNLDVSFLANIFTAFKMENPAIENFADIRNTTRLQSFLRAGDENKLAILSHGGSGERANISIVSGKGQVESIPLEWPHSFSANTPNFTNGILYAGSDGNLFRYNFRTKETPLQDSAIYGPTSLSLSKNGKILLGTNRNGIIIAFEAETLHPLNSDHTDITGVGPVVSYNRNDDTFLIAGSNGIKLFSLQTDGSIEEVDHIDFQGNGSRLSGFVSSSNSQAAIVAKELDGDGTFTLFKNVGTNIFRSKPISGKKLITPPLIGEQGNFLLVFGGDLDKNPKVSVYDIFGNLIRQFELDVGCRVIDALFDSKTGNLFFLTKQEYKDGQTKSKILYRTNLWKDPRVKK